VSARTKGGRAEIPMLTLGEAARYCGVSKATISKAIRITGDADRQLLEKLRLVHREPRFDIAPELRRARSPESNT
ncbi:MAG: hypothetical protein WCB23_01145, partial [Pseudolabrys sp.]